MFGDLWRLQTGNGFVHEVETPSYRQPQACLRVQAAVFGGAPPAWRRRSFGNELLGPGIQATKCGG